LSLDDRLARLVTTGVPGTVVAAGRDQTITTAAAGVADRDQGTPLTASHRFPVGSVSKTFVACVVLQLAAEDRLRLDDPLGKHLPGLVPDDGEIAIRQLLNHTSGLPDYVPPLLTRLREEPEHQWKPTDLVALSNGTPRGAPGAWSYSNTNYVVLGLLIEALTERPVEHALRARVAEPLGLESTALAHGGEARGYLEPSNPLLPSTGTELINVARFGSSWAWPSVISTAEDVARFLGSLLRGELLPSELLDEMLDGVESDWVESDRYGLGIEQVSSLLDVSASPYEPFWGHLGFGLGHTVVALATRDGRRQGVVMVNQGFVSENVWRQLADLVWALFM
jgi:D-alanyl-D-alanine carboxypeptidase